MISTLKLFLLSLLSVVLLCGEYAFAFHQPARLHKTTSASIALQMAGPATIEREKTVKRTSGPAVLDRPSSDKVRTPAKDHNQEGGETWEVRIYNDGNNTREHVARSLVQITGMAEMMAYQTMMMAHQNGIASVGLFCFEIAETYNEGLRHEGIVSDIIPVDEEFQ